MSGYLVVDTSAVNTCTEEETLLNSYSHEGWELAAIRIVRDYNPDTGYETQFVRYYFKKEEFKI